MSSLSINKAWDESVAFINREVRLVFPLALAFFMWPSVLIAWSQPGPSTSGVPAADETAELWLALTTLALLLPVAIGQIAIIQLALGWEGSVGGAISRAARRIWSLIGATILVYVPLLAAGLIILVLLVSASGLSNPADVTPERLATMPGLVLATVMLFLVMVVATVMLAVRLMPISAVAAAEDAGPAAMIRRAFALTKGHFWKLLGVLLLLSIATMVVSGAVQALVWLLATLLLGTPEHFTLAALVVALPTGFVNAAASSIGAILTARIYAQLAAQPTVPDVNR